jgi:catechol 2,3-dioxygenase-like lactoylglutathione lyase family enzyme
MTAWYEDVLGMKSGKRPPFAFGGAWLYCGDDPVVHLVEVAEQPKGGEPLLEHAAFQATGQAAFVGQLEAKGIRYEISKVPAFGITQVNVWDPDGNHLHIDFREAQ